MPTALAWRDQPEGDAAAPREVCMRRWEVDARARGSFMVSDASGNLIVAGSLEAEQDFGAGVLAPPSTNSERTSTFVLKLDSACNLVWSKIFVPAEDMIVRFPIALGVDDDERITLLTDSSRYTTSGLDRYYDASRLDLSLLAPDGSERGLKTFTKRYGSPLLGSVQTNWHGVTMIQNATHMGGAYDFGAGVPDATKGGYVNTLLRSDGSLIYREIYGEVGFASGPGQRLGPRGEIVAAGILLPYYGVRLDGAVQLMKIDPAGKLSWKKELHPQVELPAFYLALGVADDGSFAYWESYAPSLDAEPTSSLQERSPEGELIWDMPTVQSRRDGLLPIFLRSTRRSIALYGTLTGAVRFGNVRLDSLTPMGSGIWFVAQLEKGGATRWAISTPEEVRAIDTTPTDEVALLSAGGASLIVRKLAR